MGGPARPKRGPAGGGICMKYLTYSGNNLVQVNLPKDSTVYYPPAPIPGIHRSRIPAVVEDAFENLRGYPPLRELVNPRSRILIAFDDNCQPFPPMKKPDIRQVIIEKLLAMLVSYGVRLENIQLRCAVALHRKMKRYELAYMLGERIMSEFYPGRLKNFDAEDPEDIVHLGETEEGESVEVSRAVVDCDLVIYVDSVQIPLNGGHKSVAVGFGNYRTIAHHHSPKMTTDSPHVMSPEKSCMHASIERISKVVQKHARIVVLEAAMNGATYPPHLRYLAKSDESCNFLERQLKAMTPLSMKALPEAVRYRLFRAIRSDFDPIEINAGAIDAVHSRTLQVLRPQLELQAPRQYDALVFGLPDLSPYSVGARINPVLVVSDVLGYVFNWFYNKPFIKKGGVVIILNPVFEEFHPEYHVAYRKFYDEALAATNDPHELHREFQERYATDPALIDAYRNRYAHHGFHPFTVWYWATYPLKYLSKVILVGPPDDKAARKLGVSWAPSFEHALAMTKEATGGDDIMAITLPPFAYLTVQE